MIFNFRCIETHFLIFRKVREGFSHIIDHQVNVTLIGINSLFVVIIEKLIHGKAYKAYFWLT